MEQNLDFKKSSLLTNSIHKRKRKNLARNFTTNVPKIHVDLESSSEQVFFEN